MYLKLYLKYNLASKGHPQRVYGSQTELYELEQLVHVAGPYSSIGKASEAISDAFTSRVNGQMIDASKGHVTLSPTHTNNYKNSKQLISIGSNYILYFVITLSC